MDIELYKAEKLSQKGSSLRSMIMNNDMPILDLLVRESIQNSLDARDDSVSSRFVSVDFTIGDFDKSLLGAQLDGLSLSDRPLLSNRFIAIKDANTVGLTGEYNNKKSNLYKLVYGIMEAQSASGAGGSWGIGKTVYFRVGIGLVLYYSRIRNTDGSYDSILAAALVEDETSPNALLPAAGQDKFGIAWWGKRIDGSADQVKELRNSPVIYDVLDAFGIKPFENTSTGTIIIIPFIDENALLSNNQPKLEEGQLAPFWARSMKDFLMVSIQKWYSARMSNRKYYHSKYLNVTVNGKGIAPNDMEPFFRLTQALYNKAALTINKSPEADLVKFEDAEIKCEKIVIYSEIEPNEAGCVAFTKVNRKQLGMLPPDNCPSPYEYIKGISDADDFGKPIVMFCRKPGMAVSYQTDGKWTAGIASTAEDEYIIAYFVLNSAAKLTSSPKDISLEDYVRKSELADHTSWEDCDLGGLKPTVITKIKRSVSRKISAAYEKKDDEGDKTENTGLSSLLGRVLLPPEGFGKKPSPVPGGSGGATATFKNVRYSYSIDRFTPSGMLLNIHVTTGKKVSKTFGSEIRMDSVTGPISSPVWESEMGLEIPFVFNEIKMTVNKADGDRKDSSCTINRDGSPSICDIKCNSLISKNGDWYGISFSFEDGLEHSFDVDIIADVTVRRKDIKPVLGFEF